MDILFLAAAKEVKWAAVKLLIVGDSFLDQLLLKWVAY